jgi:PAS domain S-box-containing protein
MKIQTQFGLSFSTLLAVTGVACNYYMGLRFSLIIVAMGLLLLAAALLILNHLLQPLQDLVRDTEDISQGIYGALVPMPKAREFASLASHVNHLSEALARTTQSRDHLRLVLKDFREPLIVLDTQRRIESINQAAGRLVGYESQDLIGLPFERLWIDSNPESSSEIKTGYLTGYVQHKTVVLRSKTGTPLPISISEVPFKDEEEKDRGFIVSFQRANP